MTALLRARAAIDAYRAEVPLWFAIADRSLVVVKAMALASGNGWRTVRLNVWKVPRHERRTIKLGGGR